VIACCTAGALVLCRRRGPVEDSVVALLITLCDNVWSKRQR